MRSRIITAVAILALALCPLLVMDVGTLDGDVSNDVNIDDLIKEMGSPTHWVKVASIDESKKIITFTNTWNKDTTGVVLNFNEGSEYKDYKVKLVGNGQTYFMVPENHTINGRVTTDFDSIRVSGVLIGFFEAKNCSITINYGGRVSGNLNVDHCELNIETVNGYEGANLTMDGSVIISSKDENPIKTNATITFNEKKSVNLRFELEIDDMTLNFEPQTVITSMTIFFNNPGAETAGYYFTLSGCRVTGEGLTVYEDCGFVRDYVNYNLSGGLEGNRTGSNGTVYITPGVEWHPQDMVMKDLQMKDMDVNLSRYDGSLRFGSTAGALDYFNDNSTLFILNESTKVTSINEPVALHVRYEYAGTGPETEWDGALNKDGDLIFQLKFAKSEGIASIGIEQKFVELEGYVDLTEIQVTCEKNYKFVGWFIKEDGKAPKAIIHPEHFVPDKNTTIIAMAEKKPGPGPVPPGPGPDPPGPTPPGPTPHGSDNGSGIVIAVTTAMVTTLIIASVLIILRGRRY